MHSHRRFGYASSSGVRHLILLASRNLISFSAKIKDPESSNASMRRGLTPGIMFIRSLRFLKMSLALPIWLYRNFAPTDPRPSILVRASNAVSSSFGAFTYLRLKTFYCILILSEFNILCSFCFQGRILTNCLFQILSNSCTVVSTSCNYSIKI